MTPAFGCVAAAQSLLVDNFVQGKKSSDRLLETVNDLSAEKEAAARHRLLQQHFPRRNASESCVSGSTGFRQAVAVRWVPVAE